MAVHMRRLFMLFVTVFGCNGGYSGDDTGRTYNRSQQELRDTLDGHPSEEVQALADQLATGLSGQELDYLGRLDWSRISADAYKRDPVIRKALALAVTTTGPGKASAGNKEEEGVGSCSEGDSCYEAARDACTEVFEQAGKAPKCLLEGSASERRECIAGVINATKDQFFGCLDSGVSYITGDGETGGNVDTPDDFSDIEGWARSCSLGEDEYADPGAWQAATGSGSDTGVSDTGVSDTGEDTGTADSGESDTGEADTADTSPDDTGVSDTGDACTADVYCLDQDGDRYIISPCHSFCAEDVPPGYLLETSSSGYGHGWPSGVDCDDSDANTYPGAPEICGNGNEDDCGITADGIPQAGDC